VAFSENQHNSKPLGDFELVLFLKDAQSQNTDNISGA